MKIELDLSRRPDAAPAPLSSLAGLSLPALKAKMEAIGVEPKKANMRARQLRRWIHHFGTQDFADMTDVAKELRAQLAERFILSRPEIADHQVSRDGTQKWLTRFGPGIEGAVHHQLQRQCARPTAHGNPDSCEARGPE